jgi:hypothetical protein
MVTTHLIPEDIRATYEVQEWRNAAGVLETAHPAEWKEIQQALRSFKFRKSELLAGGGRKSLVADSFDSFLIKRGWSEKKFETKIRVDEAEWDSPTHKVDCFKGKVGLEVEWNNKDPFFDRDLNNFRLLFELRVIDVGVIVTRSSSLQELFRSLGKKVAAKYAGSTTHMDKLLPRIEGGGGGGCPILVFGITEKKYIDDGELPEGELAKDEDSDDGE